MTGKKKIAGLRRKVTRLEMKIDALLDHCKIPECEACSRIICKYSDPMHFHHDGCPSCASNEKIN